MPPLRLRLPADAYTHAPACWWGRDRWIAHCLALYDTHYAALRSTQAVESVSRKTFAAYLDAESAGADYATGRNARVTLGRLQRDVSRSESTIHRCRRLLGRLGCRTVVFRGRRRTLAESLASWNRDDQGRGWAAVAALHESTLPVDNQLLKTMLDQGIGTPPIRRFTTSHISRSESVSSNSVKGKSKPGGKARRRRAPEYDPRAVDLATRMTTDERFPLWVRRIRRGQLAALVTRKAVAGWEADDLFAGLEAFRKSGKKLIANPTNPVGYLCYVLREVPNDAPPAQMARAEALARAEAEQARWRGMFDEMQAARANAAADTSPGRLAARQFTAGLASRTAGRGRERARILDRERRELARINRG